MTPSELVTSIETAGWYIVSNEEFAEGDYTRHKIFALKVAGDVLQRKTFFYYVNGANAYWLDGNPLVEVDDNVTPYLDSWINPSGGQVAYTIESATLPDMAIARLYEESGQGATDSHAIVYRNASSVMTHRKISL